MAALDRASSVASPGVLRQKSHSHVAVHSVRSFDIPFVTGIRSLRLRGRRREVRKQDRVGESDLSCLKSTCAHKTPSRNVFASARSQRRTRKVNGGIHGSLFATRFQGTHHKHPPACHAHPLNSNETTARPEWVVHIIYWLVTLLLVP